MITVEQGAILVGFLLLCYIHQQVLDNKDLIKRLQRFYATMISKKIFAWFVVTVFFWFDRYIIATTKDWVIEYLTFTAAVFCIDVAQKAVGLKGRSIEEHTQAD